MAMRNLIFALFILLSMSACATRSCRDGSCSGWKDGGGNRTCCASHWAPTYKRGICSDCQCSDPNRSSNSCMTTRRYCEAFGNPGGR